MKLVNEDLRDVLSKHTAGYFEEIHQKLLDNGDVKSLVVCINKSPKEYAKLAKEKLINHPDVIEVYNYYFKDLVEYENKTEYRYENPNLDNKTIFIINRFTDNIFISDAVENAFRGLLGVRYTYSANILILSLMCKDTKLMKLIYPTTIRSCPLDYSTLP